MTCLVTMVVLFGTLNAVGCTVIINVLARVRGRPVLTLCCYFFRFTYGIGGACGAVISNCIYLYEFY